MGRHRDLDRGATLLADTLDAGLLVAGWPSSSRAPSAERMFIARSTVKTHLLPVFAKLGVGSRTELAAGAIHRGLVR